MSSHDLEMITQLSTHDGQYWLKKYNFGMIYGVCILNKYIYYI